MIFSLLYLYTYIHVALYRCLHILFQLINAAVLSSIFNVHTHTYTHSPFPEGKYDFSTLWGAYMSGDTEKIQVRNSPN